MLGTVLRFHLRVGTRLAMAVLVPTLTTAVGIGVFMRPDFLHDLAHVLVGAHAGLDGAALTLALSVAVAAMAAPRVCAGASGWLRQLPVTGAAHRRAATLAVAVTQLPLTLGLATLVGLGLETGEPHAGIFLHWAGLPLVALAAAQLALPVRRRAAAAAPALAAGLLAALGKTPALLAAVPLLALADLASGPLRPARRAAPARWQARRALPAWIAWRTTGGWRTLRAAAFAALPVAGAALLRANNRLAPPLPTRITLCGSTIAIAFLFAALASTLALRRPAWPWARSLPWSARRRILDDALLLAAASLPWVALTGFLDPGAALPLAGAIPLLALRAAAASRRPAASRRGAGGEILAQGLLLAGLLALVPWVVLACLATLPWALHAAAQRERHQKVGLWLDRQHLAAGDPLSLREM